MSDALSRTVTEAERSPAPASRLTSEQQAQTESSTPVTIEGLTLREALRETWANRDVVRGLLSQVLTTKMPRSILGLWWVPIMIVANSVAMAFIFGTVLTVSSGSGVPYFLFVSVGMMSWWVFNRGSLFSMRSFHRFRRYLIGMGFPAVIIPFIGAAQVTLEVGFNAAFVAVVFVVLWIADGELYLNISPDLLLAPVALLWMALLAAIVGLLTGALYWRARDVRYIYRLALPFLLFVTPIVYPVSRLDGALRVAADLNPLLPPVELFKTALFGTPGPPLYSLLAGIGTTIVLLGAGLWFTNKFAFSLLRMTEDDDLEDDI